jgi:hypothetical protein
MPTVHPDAPRARGRVPSVIDARTETAGWHATHAPLSAAIALERALRAAPREDTDFDAELERLAGWRNDPD